MINKNVRITEHVCQRFMERINPQLLSIIDYKDRLNAAEQAIKGILQDAQYVSDDERGVLLRSTTFNCDIILHNRRLITIYPCKSKRNNSRAGQTDRRHVQQNNGGHAERSRGTNNRSGQ